jgi:hypothetical protein
MQFLKPSQAVENNIGFVACSLRLVLSYTDTLRQPDETGSSEEKSGVTNQNILPHPPKGHVE